MNVRCVTFDLDDTLWAVGPVIIRAERIFYAWLEENYSRITAHYTHDALRDHRREHFRSLPELAHDLTTLRKLWLEGIAADFGYPSSMVEPAFEVFWKLRNAVELFPHATPLLDALKGRYTLGAITNGNADVAQIGIDHYFDFVVTSESVGAAKPEPAIFEAALDSANVAPGHVVHIGDDPRRDVLGAQAAGMRSIWYNPTFEMWPGGEPPDAVVRTLAEIDAVLEHWTIDS